MGGLTRTAPQLIAIAMLGWAIVPTNPYGYYMVLRWVCCAVFVYLAIEAHKKHRQGWVWIMVVTAGIYNPIVRVHATREFWTVVNIATIIIVALSVVGLRSPVPNAKPPDE